MAQPRIVELAELSSDFRSNPYPVYARLRSQGPVHRVLTPDGEDLYLVVGHEAARAAYTDPRLSRDWRRHGPLVRALNPDTPLPPYASGPGNAHVLLSEPPDHTRMRRLMAREFTTRRVAALAPRVEEIVEELLDAMTAEGRRSGDLIRDLAFPLPMTVICELLGIPDMDRAAFRAWSNETVARTSEAAEVAAYAAMMPYLGELIRDKRSRPGPDLLSALIATVDEDDDRLSEDELLSTAVLLLIAGHETTVNLIGNGMRLLFAHRKQFDLLRSDPEGLIDRAVEEILRHDGPVEASTPRVATVAVDLGGPVTIPAGGITVIVMADADRDPKRFPEPDRFDIRRDARGHIAFGHGVHFCLGAPLARLEARTALPALLRRCPGLASRYEVDRSRLDWLPGMLIRGTRTLPVSW
jgi:cytochrome P450